MVDRRYRDSGWGQPPAARLPATAAPSPSEGGEVPASPPIAPNGPEIDPAGQSCAAPPPATITQDGWGRPPATANSPTKRAAWSKSNEFPRPTAVAPFRNAIVTAAPTPGRSKGPTSRGAFQNVGRSYALWPV